MPRKPRIIQPNHIYHVLNRSNARLTIFHTHEDYAAFDRTLHPAHQRHPLRILAYVLMPNHFHLVLWPSRGHEQNLSLFMRWLQLTHTQRHHAFHHSAGTGHLYQGRFKSFPVQGDHHFLTACRYVERNALRANLVKRAELWPFSSLHRRIRNSNEDQQLLADFPQPPPSPSPAGSPPSTPPNPKKNSPPSATPSNVAPPSAPPTGPPPPPNPKTSNKPSAPAAAPKNKALRTDLPPPFSHRA